MDTPESWEAYLPEPPLPLLIQSILACLPTHVETKNEILSWSQKNRHFLYSVLYRGWLKTIQQVSDADCAEPFDPNQRLLSEMPLCDQTGPIYWKFSNFSLRIPRYQTISVCIDHQHNPLGLVSEEWGHIFAWNQKNNLIVDYTAGQFVTQGDSKPGARMKVLMRSGLVHQISDHIFALIGNRVEIREKTGIQYIV